MTAPLPLEHPSRATRDPEFLVRLESVTKIFPGRGGSQALTALSGVDLAVPVGSVTGVIGRSGAGKSTLIRLINGLEKPTTGRVFVGGTEISGLEEPELRDARRSIGMIFQHFNLLSVRTAAENVALPLELAHTSKAAIRTRVDELLELVGLADKRDSYPAQLSGGQKQRVGIARALATRPKLLLSDEATSALDPETTRSILDLLGRINREFGLTILLITHEMSVIRAIAREVAVMDAGRIVEHGDVFDIFARPRHPVMRTFLAEETGRNLPPSLRKRLRRESIPHGQTIVRVTFRGAHARDPIIADLAQREGIAANIIAGAVGEIEGFRVA